MVGIDRDLKERKKERKERKEKKDTMLDDQQSVLKGITGH